MKRGTFTLERLTNSTRVCGDYYLHVLFIVQSIYYNTFET